MWPQWVQQHGQSSRVRSKHPVKTAVSFHSPFAGCVTCKGCGSPLRLPVQGPVHAATTIFREEGLLGLWSGAAPTVMRNGTNQMCLFWAKNNFDGLFFGKEEGDGRVLAPWQSMMSGFSAACLGPVATGPFDVIKVTPFCPDCPSLFPHTLMRYSSQRPACGFSQDRREELVTAKASHRCINRGFGETVILIPFSILS